MNSISNKQTEVKFDDQALNRYNIDGEGFCRVATRIPVYPTAKYLPHFNTSILTQSTDEQSPYTPLLADDEARILGAELAEIYRKLKGNSDD